MIRMAPLAGVGIMLCSLLAARAATQVVLIDDHGFDPPDLTVNVGDEVLWVNDGMKTHTAVAAGGEWNSGRLQPLEFYATVLTRAGTFPYSCTLHPGETGLVTVVVGVFPPSVSVISPANGTSYGQPAAFRLSAIASDSDGTVSNVTFQSDGGVLAIDPVSPFDVIVTDLAAGDHVLQANATDNQGNVGTSAPVQITVTVPGNGNTHWVHIQDFRFAPQFLNVTEGDTVIWRNLDPTNHTATGVFTSREALCGSTLLNDTRSCTNTFRNPGTFAYFCGLHPSERGTVTVSRAAIELRLVSPLVAADGRFQFDLITSPGRTYVIQGSDGLPPIWRSIQTNLATTDLLRFTEGDTRAPNRLRFFRALIQP